MPYYVFIMIFIIDVQYMNVTIDLKNRIIHKSDYSIFTYPPDNIDLNTIMLLYFDGESLKAISLDIMKKYPILYDIDSKPDSNDDDTHANDTDDSDDNYSDNDNNNDLDLISIIVCPFSLSGGVFTGEFRATQEIINNSLVITNGIEKFPIIKSDINSNKYRISDIIIKPLRNILSEYMHTKFIHYNNKNNNNKNNDINNYNYVAGNDFYSTNSLSPNISYTKQEYLTNITFHPKTLVYIISYESSKTDERKYTIIVGKDANKNTITGYNDKTSGFFNYLSQLAEEINERNGCITPVLWYAWKSAYPNAKIILLTD